MCASMSEFLLNHYFSYSYTTNLLTLHFIPAFCGFFSLSLFSSFPCYCCCSFTFKVHHHLFSFTSRMLFVVLLPMMMDIIECWNEILLDCRPPITKKIQLLPWLLLLLLFCMNCEIEWNVLLCFYFQFFLFFCLFVSLSLLIISI